MLEPGVDQLAAADLDITTADVCLPRLQRLAIVSQPFVVSLPAMGHMTSLRELYAGGARWCAQRSTAGGKLKVYPHCYARAGGTNQGRCASNLYATGARMRLWRRQWRLSFALQGSI